MSTHEGLEKQLLERYKKIGTESIPASAVRQKYDQQHFVAPSIPFVGKYYAEQKTKILVYASGEVLSNYYPGSPSERPWLDDDTQAIRRHRVRFEATKNNPDFFPDVHIQPMNDGTLATAVLYIASQYMDIGDQLPRAFYERICIANLIKYTKETEQQENIREGRGNYGSSRNVDITQMSKEEANAYFHASHPHLESDLDILRPNIVILPQTLYKKDKAFWLEHKQKFGFSPIRIYQLGPKPINLILPKLQVPPKDPHTLHPTVNSWRKNIHHFSEKNYLRVFTHLDKASHQLNED